MNADVEALRRELEEAFAGRAHLYREMLDALEAELGADRAETLMREVLEKRGAAVSGQLFKGCAATPQAVGARFLSVSPDGGRMYPHSVADDGAALHVKVARCPLKDAWVGAGLAPARVAQLCAIAGAFDKGLFEAAGVAFANETWSQKRGGGCCWISLSPA